MYYILLLVEQSARMLHTQVAPPFHSTMDADKMLVSMDDLIMSSVVCTCDMSRQLLHKNSGHFVNLVMSRDV